MNTLQSQNDALYAVTIISDGVPRNKSAPATGTDTSASKPTQSGLRYVAGILMLASLLACGSMPGERAVSGAGIGAGAGAAVGAVTGMGVGTGAAVGAAAGAAAGGLTKEKDVNLGKPVWK